MNETKHISYPKITRWNTNWVITEKIDGTNAQLLISKATTHEGATDYAIAEHDGKYLFAGSRNKWLKPVDDNFGFASWALAHAQELIDVLGEGQHYGEWWGLGIQRRYGLTEKRFSLFNTRRWTDETKPACCHVVPVLEECEGADLAGGIQNQMARLEIHGSVAAPGFKSPEGIVVFNTVNHVQFKITDAKK